MPVSSKAQAPTCGLANPGGLGGKIVGGELAGENEWPWVASLLCTGKFFCTASILSETWILTAAHCVDGCSNWEVTVGANNWRNPSGEYFQVIESLRGFTVDTWNTNTLANDIALVELATPIKFNGEIFLKKLKGAMSIYGHFFNL